MPQNEDPLQFASQKLLTTFAEGLRKVRRSQHLNYRSRTMCRHVLKGLDLKPYCVTVVQLVQEADVVKRVNYSMWLLNSMSSHSRIKKIGVWCDVSGTHITGPIFIDRTLNTEVYMNIFEEFCAQLTEKERQSFFFQQDGSTCHFSRVSLQRVHDVFSEERTVSKNLWPRSSPDLTTCDYFLW